MEDAPTWLAARKRPPAAAAPASSEERATKLIKQAEGQTRLKGKGDDNGKGRGKFQGDVNPRARAREAIRASAIGENPPQAAVDHRSNGHDDGKDHGSGHAPTCPTCRQPWPRKLDSPLQAPSELTWHPW